MAGGNAFQRGAALFQQMDGIDHYLQVTVAEIAHGLGQGDRGIGKENGMAMAVTAIGNSKVGQRSNMSTEF
ncbi:hypothetical protein VI01_13200 [Pantoea sp. SM3]|nr:hypothetical protein VI01_13200 [Pantoea sp. SM3]